MSRHRWEVMTAADMMKTDIVAVSADAPLAEIRRSIAEKGVSGVAVRDSRGAVVGVVSWRDIIDARQQSAETHDYYTGGGIFEPPSAPIVPPPLRAKDVMNDQLITIPMTADLKDVAGLMSEYRIHRLFVTDEDSKIVGILSTLDVMDALSA